MSWRETWPKPTQQRVVEEKAEKEGKVEKVAKEGATK
jgi:hypothetical protein